MSSISTFPQSLGYKLHKLAALLDKAADTTLFAELGVNQPQLFLLLAVEQGNTTQEEVARFLDPTPGAVSRLVAALVQRRSINSEKNPQNRREHIVTLTAKGRAILNVGLELLEQQFSAHLENSTKEEQATVEQFIDALLNSKKN